MPRAAHVRVAILDAAGRTVRVVDDAEFSVGRYRRAWDGLDSHGRIVPSGVYFVVATSGQQQVVRRVVRVK